MKVAFDTVFRRFCGYNNFSSASKMFVENRVDNFETGMIDREDLFMGSVKGQMPKKQFSRLLDEHCGMVKFWITTSVYAVMN